MEKTPEVLVERRPEPLAKISSEKRAKVKKQETQLQRKQRLSNVIVKSRLKPSTLPHDSIISEPTATGQVEIQGTTYFYHDDLPLNRRGYKYKPCMPCPLFPSNKYATTELAPYTVRVSHFDRSQGVGCSADMAGITTPSGWLLARCNIALRSGLHYFEYDIVHANVEGSKAHVRIGIGRKELSLEAPVGFDGYAYGLRDVTGQKLTLSRPESFMESFSSGDTIGFLVNLPLMLDHRRTLASFDKKTLEEETRLNSHSNIFRDHIPIKYKNGLYFEQFEYTRTKQMDHLLNPVTVFGEKAVVEEIHQDALPVMQGSLIVVYKNGQCMGEMFKDLYLFLLTPQNTTTQLQNPQYCNTDDGSLGYYPMMLAFQNGVVRINPGPDFKFAVPEGATPLCEEFDNSVVEEWLWDIIDEVDAEYIDSFE